MIVNNQLGFTTPGERGRYLLLIVCTISNTETASSTLLNTEKRVENTTHRGVFLTNFEVLGNVVKHCLECLMYLLSGNRT